MVFVANFRTLAGPTALSLVGTLLMACGGTAETEAPSTGAGGTSSSTVDRDAPDPSGGSENSTNPPPEPRPPEPQLPEPPSCDVVVLLENRCGGSICHGSGPADDPSAVNLFGDDLAERFVDVPALAYRDLVVDPENCPDEPEMFIDSGNLEASLMWTKITDTHACGDPMPIPYQVTALPQDELDCIYEWMELLVAEKAGR